MTANLYERIESVMRDGSDAGPEPVGRMMPRMIGAVDLMAKVFPEPRWAVPGVFSEGLSLLVGAPKLGKSWLALNVAAAVAFGGRALGSVEVEGGDVLYLALEDTERRLQDRLRMMLGSEVPARLTLATEWPDAASGGLACLDSWLTEHPEARLVFIDTFQKFRGPVDARANAYSGDYAAAAPIKALADRHRVAIVVVHHTRKMGADDPLDMVSGTQGLAGAADTTLVLRREVGRADAALYVRGRDVPEADHAVSFDADVCMWRLLGDAGDFKRSEERQEIIEVLRSSPEPMRPKAIAEALGKKDGAVRYLLSKMLEAGEVENVGGVYTVPANTPNTSSETRMATGNLLLGDTPNTPLTVPNTPNSHPASLGVLGGVSDTPNSEYPRNGAEKRESVRGVRGLGEGVDGGGVCEVCGDPTNGEMLCWSCR